jgi:hypothetical protein
VHDQRYVTKRVTLTQIMLKMYATISVGDKDVSPQKNNNSKN